MKNSRLNLFHDFTDEELEALDEIGRQYPDRKVGATGGLSCALRQAARVLLAMSPAEREQHLGNGQFRPVGE